MLFMLAHNDSHKTLGMLLIAGIVIAGILYRKNKLLSHTDGVADTVNIDIWATSVSTHHFPKSM